MVGATVRRPGVAAVTAYYLAISGFVDHLKPPTEIRGFECCSRMDRLTKRHYIRTVFLHPDLPISHGRGRSFYPSESRETGLNSEPPGQVIAAVWTETVLDNGETVTVHYADPQVLQSLAFGALREWI